MKKKIIFQKMDIRDEGGGAENVVAPFQIGGGGGARKKRRSSILKPTRPVLQDLETNVVQEATKVITTKVRNIEDLI